MPTYKLKSQNGNSCAAHCTVVAIAEMTESKNDEKFAEEKLWPSIKFVDKGGATAVLAAQENSDPRLIVSEIRKRWPSVNAKLICDDTQKNDALKKVNQQLKQGMNSLFNLLSMDAAKAPVQLDECVYYNCSFTMHDGGDPTASNYSGMHNILVVFEGGKVHYYNPNENYPSWQTTHDWKTLKNQNGGNHSYVFSGVSVAIF